MSPKSIRYLCMHFSPAVWLSTLLCAGPCHSHSHQCADNCNYTPEWGGGSELHSILAVHSKYNLSTIAALALLPAHLSRRISPSKS